MIIERFLSEQNLARMRKDFGFLLEGIPSHRIHIDIALRRDYFNLYHRGNSLAKVEFRESDYIVCLARKFYDSSVLGASNRFAPPPAGADPVRIRLSPELLHPFFQKKHLDDLCKQIRETNYSEELAFEQLLIADNRDREDFVLIDRQVTDTALKGRMDLLALRQVEGNRYRFEVVEVKLVVNDDVDGKVVGQLDTYVRHINAHFDDYKTCYEEHYRQKKILGLLEQVPFGTIEVIGGVMGAIVVTGYSGATRQVVDHLRQLSGSYRVLGPMCRIPCA